MMMIWITPVGSTHRDVFGNEATVKSFVWIFEWVMNIQLLSKELNSTNRIKIRKIDILLVKLVYDTMNVVFFRLWIYVAVSKTYVLPREVGQYNT